MAYKKRHHASEHMGKSKQGHGGYGVTQNEDSRMIGDDWSAPALLPRMVMDKDWPRSENYMNYGEADLFMGVQKQLKEDSSDMKREFKAGKY